MLSRRAGGSPTTASASPPRAPPSPFECACSGNVTDLESLLQEQGQEFVCERDENGWLMSHFAARNGRVDVLRFIAENNGDAGFTATTSKHGITAAHLAARGGHVDVLRYLAAEKGGDIFGAEDEDFWTAAHSAARGGHVDALRFIVEQLGAVAVLRRPPFHPTLERIAAKYHHVEVLKYLAEQAEIIEYELFSALEHARSEDGRTDCDVSSEFCE